MQKDESFRKIFLPTEGYIFAKYDYDAMEVCIGSQVSGKGSKCNQKSHFLA